MYIRGNKEILNGKNIGIVGCRECTDYGKKAAKYFAYNLSKEKSINIVSGLAKGVDSYAHWGSVGANIECESTKNCGKKQVSCGKTIAVLGNGLDMIYPKENIELAKNIIKSGGCIISEYSIGTKPERLHFPQRNRIISGISNGVLVVEATKKSGALITADFAIEQGKEVYAIPGDINRKESEGCNELIKDGAILVTSYKEILENCIEK